MNESAEPIVTDFIALRQAPYGESNLVVTGISPECGRLLFAVFGGLHSGKRAHLPFGLFRLLQVSFTPAERDIQTCDSCDLLADYGTIARSYSRYECACWLAQFAVANTLPAMRCPYFFTSLKEAFKRLADPSAETCSTAAVQTAVLFVYMLENGLAPDLDSDPRQREQADQLFAMAMGGDSPHLSEDTWIKLRDWAIATLRNGECKIP